jgi:hypothetical protein
MFVRNPTPPAAAVILKFRRDLDKLNTEGGMINSVGPTVEVIDVVTDDDPCGATVLYTKVL